MLTAVKGHENKTAPRIASLETSAEGESKLGEVGGGNPPHTQASFLVGNVSGKFNHDTGDGSSSNPGEDPREECSLIFAAGESEEEVSVESGVILEENVGRKKKVRNWQRERNTSIRGEKTGEG